MSLDSSFYQFDADMVPEPPPDLINVPQTPVNTTRRPIIGRNIFNSNRQSMLGGWETQKNSSIDNDSPELYQLFPKRGNPLQESHYRKYFDKENAPNDRPPMSFSDQGYGLYMGDNRRNIDMYNDYFDKRQKQEAPIIVSDNWRDIQSLQSARYENFMNNPFVTRLNPNIKDIWKYDGEPGNEEYGASRKNTFTYTQKDYYNRAQKAYSDEMAYEMKYHSVSPNTKRNDVMDWLSYQQDSSYNKALPTIFEDITNNNNRDHYSLFSKSDNPRNQEKRFNALSEILTRNSSEGNINRQFSPNSKNYDLSELISDSSISSYSHAENDWPERVDRQFRSYSESSNYSPDRNFSPNSQINKNWTDHTNRHFNNDCGKNATLAEIWSNVVKRSQNRKEFDEWPALPSKEGRPIYRELNLGQSQQNLPFAQTLQDSRHIPEYNPGERALLPLVQVKVSPTLSTSSSSPDVPFTKICNFCRKNGEKASTYSTHFVKEKIEGDWVVTCPILRSYVCTVCSVTGDKAHTITHCPLLRLQSLKTGQPLRPTTISLKNTPRKSSGKKRHV